MLLPFQAVLRPRRSIDVGGIANSPTLSTSDTVVDGRDTPLASPSTMSSAFSVPFILIIGGPKGPNAIRSSIKGIADAVPPISSILTACLTATTYAFLDSLLS